MSQPRIVITINGPGEVSAWLHPLGPVLRDMFPDAHIAVALMPCVFATGAERDVVAALPFADAVCTPKESRALAFWGRKPEGFDRTGPGLHLHLGGDMFLARMMAWRLRLPSVAYLEHPQTWSALYQRVFYTGFGQLPARAEPKKHLLVGDMMVDAMMLRRPADLEISDRPKVALFPGSRDYIVKYTLPFLAMAVDEVAAQMPDVEWSISASRFLPPEFFMNLPQVDGSLPFPLGNLTSRREGDRVVVLTEAGNRLVVEPPERAIFEASLAVTLPGTTTGELAAIGKPMVLVLPYYLAETAPLPGLAGHLGSIPVVGRYIKRLVAQIHHRGKPVFSHANLRSGKTIVPEVVGYIRPTDVSAAIVGVLRSDMSLQADALRETMGQPGAATRIAAEIRPYFESRGRRGKAAA